MWLVMYKAWTFRGHFLPKFPRKSPAVRKDRVTGRSAKYLFCFSTEFLTKFPLQSQRNFTTLRSAANKKNQRQCHSYLEPFSTRFSAPGRESGTVGLARFSPGASRNKKRPSFFGDRRFLLIFNWGEEHLRA